MVTALPTEGFTQVDRLPRQRWEAGPARTELESAVGFQSLCLPSLGFPCCGRRAFPNSWTVGGSVGATHVKLGSAVCAFVFIHGIALAGSPSAAERGPPCLAVGSPELGPQGWVSRFLI